LTISTPSYDPYSYPAPLTDLDATDGLNYNSETDDSSNLSDNPSAREYEIMSDLHLRKSPKVLSTVTTHTITESLFGDPLTWDVG
jgi:hypothetical protein